MNLGVTHNRRPYKTKSHGISLNSIAKQMGIDPKTLGQEAENMWKMLDDLSESDPQAYRDFIDKQLREGPPPATPHFIPEPGFVTKTATTLGDRKIFLNCCSHLAIEKPKDRLDKPVPDDTHDLRTTSGIQLPLAIGECRGIKDKNGGNCVAIDVVFNPWVIKRCEWDYDFKLEVVKLAVEWVEKEKAMKLTRPSRLIKSRYKGGIKHGNEIKAVPFLVNDPNGNGQSGALVLKGDIVENNPPREEFVLKMPEQAQPQHHVTNQQQPRRILIEEISPVPVNSRTENNSQDEECLSTNLKHQQDIKKTDKEMVEEIPTQRSINEIEREASIKSSRKTKPVIKKGFLNSSKGELYPNGSNEGLPPSAYVKLLSRSKVVDLSQVNLKSN